ncbi:MAG: hypothetical protein A2X17_08860 [Bacteroidetes bacterium GWF2_41_61]|nr:MAG: hypothetical protein A2X17_08860 [Bacteroidetes bacterium GWF2_41_61]HBG23670.1 hypothetical protein [Rikenellaceae bacterium]
MKMDEDIIIRVIRGEATPIENMRVLDWIRESDDNLKEFSELKMIWTLSSTPSELAKEEDLITFKKDISARSAFKFRTNKFWFGFASAISVAIVILLIGLFSGIFVTENIISDNKIATNNLTMVNQRYMYTDKGVKGKVILPDGSIVWLNSDTKLTYPDLFSVNKREVEISGEAFFDVVKDSIRPMFVKTGKGFTIKVLGTKFNVKSYENDQESKAILYSGSIELITQSGNNEKEVILDLKPNECATIAFDGTTRISQVDKSTDIAWLRGEIIFEDTPMREVLKVIERWYGKKFDVRDSSFYNYKLNASFKSESLVQILDIINLCTSVKYKIVDDRVIFQ